MEKGGLNQEKAMLTEVQIEEIHRTMEKMVSLLIEERDRSLITLEEIRKDIQIIESFIAIADDTGAELVKIRDSLLGTQKTLEEFIDSTNEDIIEHQARLERIKLEDQQRREKLLENFEGTTQ